jgi:hypothetical protein
VHRRTPSTQTLERPPAQGCRSSIAPIYACMPTFDDTSALVIGIHDLSAAPPPPLSALREDMKLAKAGALYADRVAVASFSASHTILGITGDLRRAFGSAAGVVDQRARAKLQQAFEVSLDDLTSDDEQALEDLARGLNLKAFWLPSIFESGVLVIDHLARWRFLLETLPPHSILSLYARPDHGIDASQQPRRRLALRFPRDGAVGRARRRHASCGRARPRRQSTTSLLLAHAIDWVSARRDSARCRQT